MKINFTACVAERMVGFLAIEQVRDRESEIEMERNRYGEIEM